VRLPPTVTPSGQSTLTWSNKTIDPRALQRPGTGSSRIAASWYSTSGHFTVDINLTDGQSHLVSIYALDWDKRGRSERVDVVDPTTGVVLDSRTLTAFTSGTYLDWTLSGHVQLVFTVLAGNNSVVSGLFFDKGGSAPATIGKHTHTHGSLKGVHRSPGSHILTAPPATPFPRK